MRYVAALLLLLGTAGCSGLSDSSNDEIRVATAFYPLQYVAERVAGGLATVENLTQPGAEPHSLELNIQQTATISRADLVVHESGFQPTVADSIEQNATGVVVVVTEVIELRDFPDGQADPHFWQDPLRMATLGDRVAERLAEVDPDHAGTYAANAADLRSDLESLHDDYASGLADCERTTIVVSHDAFGYLREYGLTIEPVAGLSPDSEPTAAALARLQRLIRSDGITTVFSERLVSPRLTQSLASDTGITTAILDPIEGLSDADSADDYLSLMRDNLAALELANGCR